VSVNPNVNLLTSIITHGFVLRRKFWESSAYI